MIGQETSRRLGAAGRGARNILNIQGTNIESAIKAEDLAKTRLFTSIGSQVEILSAQTALTDACDFYTVALRNYSVAYSSCFAQPAKTC